MRTRSSATQSCTETTSSSSTWSARAISSSAAVGREMRRTVASSRSISAVSSAWACSHCASAASMTAASIRGSAPARWVRARPSTSCATTARSAVSADQTR